METMPALNFRAGIVFLDWGMTNDLLHNLLIVSIYVLVSRSNATERGNDNYKKNGCVPCSPLEHAKRSYQTAFAPDKV